MIELLDQEIAFHTTSYCDRRGRVFWWQGELYRGIAEPYVSFYQKLFDQGIVARLVGQGYLVGTELTDLSLKGYPLVLKHQVLPFVSYAHEWCPAMFKDAALFVADLMIELADHQLTLADAHTYDLLFHGSRPVFVDFTTIIAADYDGDRSWKQYRDDVRNHFINPLRLMAQGYGKLARWLLADYDQDVLREFSVLLDDRNFGRSAKRATSDLLWRMGRRLPAMVHPLAGKGLRLIPGTQPLLAAGEHLKGRDLVQRLRQEIESISLTAADARQLQGEPDQRSSPAPAEEWTEKQLLVSRILSDTLPHTVLDIGCARGWYALLAASFGSDVVALDIDDQHVTACYREAAARRLPILPLVVDIRAPAPGYGAGNTVVVPALERLRCDMVFALGLVHQLCFDQHATFEQLGDTFARLAKKHLLVEFVSREDPEVREQPLGTKLWYTLDHFITTLRRHFRQVTTIALHSGTRTLLLCEH